MHPGGEGVRGGPHEPHQKILKNAIQHKNKGPLPKFSQNPSTPSK